MHAPQHACRWCKLNYEPGDGNHRGLCPAILSITPVMFEHNLSSPA